MNPPPRLGKELVTKRGSFDRGRYSFLAPSQSCLHRAGAKTTGKVPLEDQEQDDDRKAAENAHGHDLVPFAKLSLAKDGF